MSSRTDGDRIVLTRFLTKRTDGDLRVAKSLVTSA
jgi:hypothetical protein